MLKKSDDLWVLDNSEGQTPGEFFDHRYLDHFGTGEDLWLADAGPLLIARALGTIEGLPNVIKSAPLPPDRVRLFLYADLPDGFRVQDPRFGNQEGHVLYVQDVFKP